MLVLTGTCAWVAAEQLWWPWVVLILFCHGTFYSFINNGVHELVHETVFRTNIFNKVFLWIYSFISMNNHLLIWVSHTEHHKYTLHPPDDLDFGFG